MIVDTGSADGTPELIESIMQEYGIPGEIHHREWVNFAHNRQQALDLAVSTGRADWLLFIDADEELAWTEDHWFRQLVPGLTYQLEKHHGPIRYPLPNLIWVRDIAWRWEGVVHECIKADREHPRQLLKNVWIIYHSGEGYRSRGVSTKVKYLRDAELLEEALRVNPDDARSQFYLAQSCRDAGEYERAYLHYERRVHLGGWPEEVFIAQCEKAALAIGLGLGHDCIVGQHLSAFSLRPTRAESLWQLAVYCRERQRYAEGYIYAKVAKDIPMPAADLLFLRPAVYAWQLLDEFAICAYWAGFYQEAAEAGQKILIENRFEPEHRPRLEANLQFALQRLQFPPPVIKAR